MNFVLQPWQFLLAIPADFIEAGYFQQAIDVLLETGRFSYEGEKVRKTGERFPASILFTLTKDKSGKVVGFVEIVQDLTDRNRAEEELRRAKEAAESANRAKSEFLANMSHEIRTPMNGILGMTELALDTELAPEQRQYLGMVKSSAESLLTVINDILDFSKIEAGKLDLEAIDFPLRDRLGDTMKALALRAHKKGVELACHVVPEAPDALVGDPGRLCQIVVNLVGNAIKFTEHGEVVVRVDREEVSRTDAGGAEKDEAGKEKDPLAGAAVAPSSGPSSASSRETVLHFAVSDTGIGIPREKLGRIFEPFTQADTSTTRQYGGTGLGLTISGKLLGLMGGRIWVESGRGWGSTFHFTIPLGLQAAPAAPAPAAEPVDLHDLPVLVVDDNATNRFILKELLIRWQMRPTVVADGRTALSEMKQATAAGKPFALVLSDSQMPGMDGFALAEQIRRGPDLAGVTLMMLSSADQQKEISRCRQLGINAFLMKPIKQSELLDAIVTALRVTAGKDKQAEAATRGPGVGPAPRPPAAPGWHILLAEDNAINQTLAIILLEKLGHTVVVANNGKEALAHLGISPTGGPPAAGPGTGGLGRQPPFDLVLMDVQMPEMDGFEATALIRAQEKKAGRHLPIIAMTAHAMKGDRERCLQAGMDCYVAKPIQTAELVRALADHGPAGTRPPAEALAAGPADVAPAAAPNMVFDRAAALKRVGQPENLCKLIAGRAARAGQGGPFSRTALRRAARPAGHSARESGCRRRGTPFRPPDARRAGMAWRHPFLFAGFLPGPPAPFPAPRPVFARRSSIFSDASALVISSGSSSPASRARVWT